MTVNDPYAPTHYEDGQYDETLATPYLDSHGEMGIPPAPPILIEKRYGPLRFVIVLASLVTIFGSIVSYSIGAASQTKPTPYHPIAYVNATTTPTGTPQAYTTWYNDGYRDGLKEESSWLSRNCQKNGDGYYEITFKSDGTYSCASSGNYSYQDTQNDLAAWTAKNCTKDANGHYEMWWSTDNNGNIQLNCY